MSDGAGARPPEEIRSEILGLVQKYEAALAVPPFEPGKTRMLQQHDSTEMVGLVVCSLDFWLTLGPCGHRFERRMRNFFGARDFVLVNSGSAANLLMVSTACAPALSRQTGKAPLAPRRKSSHGMHLPPRSRRSFRTH